MEALGVSNEQTAAEVMASTAAIRAFESAKEERLDQVALSNGMIFKIRKVPPLLIRRAQMQLVKPRVPLWLNPDKDREEENPNDPTYLEAKAAYEEAGNIAALNAALLLGTSILEKPDDLPGPDSDEFREILEALAIEVPNSVPGRYLRWIEFAIPDPEDLLKIGAAVGRASGLREEDVEAAVDSFRSREGGGAPPESELPKGPPHGSDLPASDGWAGAGDRGAGSGRL